MAKRNDFMSYNQRNKYGPSVIPQASNKSNNVDLAMKAASKKMKKQAAKPKPKVRSYKYLGPSGVEAEFGSIEMFRNKNTEQRRDTVLSMFRRIKELVNTADKNELEKLLKLQPNSFQMSGQYSKLFDLGANEQSILEADVDKLEKYFITQFNVLSLKTIYKDQRERLIEEREKENEFIKSSYTSSGSQLSYDEYREHYFRMKGIIIDRLKMLKDSGEAVQAFNEFITNNPNFNENDIENLANRVASDINENAEEQLELNRRAAVARAEKRAYRNMSVQDRYTLSQIEQLGRDYNDLYEEYINQGPALDDTFANYVDRIYKSKVTVDTKEIKLKVDPGEKPYLRSIVKEHDPGYVFELNTPSGTRYYIIERHDEHKGARFLDDMDISDMQIIEEYKGKTEVENTDDFGFRIEKPIVRNNGYVTLPDDEDMGDLF